MLFSVSIFRICDAHDTQTVERERYVVIFNFIREYFGLLREASQSRRQQTSIAIIEGLRIEDEHDAMEFSSSHSEDARITT